MTTPVVVEFRDPRVPDIFWNKVLVRPDGCWEWTGAINSRGYSSCWDGELRKTQLGHRFIWRMTVGDIPAGLTVDHLCHTRDESCRDVASCPHRRCVNPAHLEPVTGRTNNLRGRSPFAENARRTRCVNGHEFTPANTLIRPSSGHRVCRACRFTADPTKRPGVKPGSKWSPARRAAYEASRLLPDLPASRGGVGAPTASGCVVVSGSVSPRPGPGTT